MTATRVPLTVGTRMTGADDAFTIVRWEFHDGQLNVVVDRGGERHREPYDEFLQQAQDLVPVEPTGSYYEFTRDTRFPYLDDVERAKLKQLTADLLEVLHGDPGGMVWDARPGYVPRTEYDPAVTSQRERITAKVKEMRGRPTGGAASQSGLYRLLRKFEDRGVEGLIHESKLAKFNTIARLAEADVIMAAAHDLVLELGANTRSTTSKKNQLALFRSRLLDSGVDLDGIPKATLRTILDVEGAKYRIDKPAGVRHNQSSRPDGFYGRRIVTRPGEFCHMDVATLDAKAWNPVTGWVTVDAITIMDAYDRRVRAFMLVPAPHTARDISIAIGRMLMPPTINSGRHALTDHWWEGAPEVLEIPAESTPTTMEGTPVTGRSVDAIMMDHGAQFDSKLVSLVATRAGIHTVFAAPRKGHHKGVVESFHNRLKFWSQQFPGDTGARTQHRGRHAEDQALFTIAELEAALQYRIDALYHQGPHESLRDPANPSRRISPNEAYALYIANGGAPHVLARPGTAFDFLPSRLCRADDEGIDVNGIRYDGPALTELRDRIRGPRSPHLRVCWDPYDPTRIYVQHPTSGTWMTVRDYGTQIGSQVPLGESMRTTSWTNQLKQFTSAIQQIDLTEAKLLQNERKDQERKLKRKLGLNLERLLLAERDRARLSIAMLAPDPSTTWERDELPQFVDPNFDVEDNDNDAFDEDIANAGSVMTWN
ncbi:Mu transposase C-terminal domain-containing protein [Cellulomonas sp. GbtcB1]|uniref:Mu transposase C-terminal domain-containing protein n=1 Tax=Cellulomonas sp. GbtcB1 TaxID=2824746 RepID=UPI001C2FE942|nr:Mu transposase C-terminal domain-containing protein [Cellulomonas sp. GbtcB1]